MSGKQLVNSHIEKMIENSLNFKIISMWHNDSESLNCKGWHSLPDYVIAYMIQGDVTISLRSKSDELKPINWSSGDIICFPSNLVRKNHKNSAGNIRQLVFIQMVECQRKLAIYGRK